MKIYCSLIVSLGIQNTVTKRLHTQQQIDNKIEQATILADFSFILFVLLDIYCFAFISSGEKKVEAKTNKQTKNQKEDQAVHTDTEVRLLSYKVSCSKKNNNNTNLKTVSPGPKN